MTGSLSAFCWLMFGPDGYAGRRSYALGVVASSLFGWAAMAFLSDPLGLSRGIVEVGPSLGAAYALVGASWVALLAKRMRDVGVHVGWAAVALVPGVQLFVLLGFLFPQGSVVRMGRQAP